MRGNTSYQEHTGQHLRYSLSLASSRRPAMGPSQRQGGYGSFSRAVSQPNQNQMGTRMIGNIKKLVSERGFGFIAGNDGQDVFFHFSACRAMSGTPDPKLFENLKPGDSVEYELDRSGRHTGLRASLVSLKAYKADVPRCAICDRDTVQDPVKPILMSNKLVCRPCAYNIVALTAEMIPGPQGALARAPIGSVSKARFSDGEEA